MDVFCLILLYLKCVCVFLSITQYKYFNGKLIKYNVYARDNTKSEQKDRGQNYVNSRQNLNLHIIATCKSVYQ